MRPLLVCDCDEVLMSFARPIAAHLEEAHRLELRLTSFRLAGNIFRRDDGDAVPARDFRPLLTGFFRDAMHRQTAVPGAAEALRRLSDEFDIVILTNIEDEFAGRREAQLRDAGMPYPVHCNRGPKGPALARLLAAHGGPPAAFIDDLPPHHASVAEQCPAVHRIHMVADPRLRGLVPEAAAAHARIDEWTEAEPYLFAAIGDKLLEPAGRSRKEADHDA